MSHVRRSASTSSNCVVRARGREVLLLVGAVVVRREAVDADHRVAAREQRLREMTADEPGRAGHERAHRSVRGFGERLGERGVHEQRVDDVADLAGGS